MIEKLNFEHCQSSNWFQIKSEVLPELAAKIDELVEWANGQERDRPEDLIPDEKTLVGRLNVLLRLEGLTISSARRPLHTHAAVRSGAGTGARLLLSDVKSGEIAIIRVFRDGVVEQEK